MYKYEKYNKKGYMKVQDMSIRVNKHKILGICVAKIQEYYQGTLVRVIVKEAKKRGYKSIVFNGFCDMYFDNPNNKGEAEVYKLLHKEHIDALVVLSETIKRDSVCKKIIDFAGKNSIPVVTVDRPIGDCINIEFDCEEAFERIVRHIVEEHRCKTVNFIAGYEDNDFSNTRLNCYKRVLLENGIEYDETRVGYGNFWVGPTRAVMERFLDDPRGIPEAIICSNDIMAMTASQMLQERGYRIPDDVLITGFDGIEAEKYTSPRLTTAVTDFDMLSIKVMDTLDSLANDGDIHGDLKVGFKHRIAQSCGCKAVNAYEAASKITELYDKMSFSRGHEEFMYNFLSDTLGCKTYKQLAKVSAKYCEDMHIWVCLNRDYFRDVKLPKYNGKFTRDMVLFYQANNRKLLDFCKEYKFEEYLPDFNKILDKSDVLMFSVIHYQSTVYGYAVSEIDIDIDIDEHKFDSYQRYLNNTNQILESIHKSVKLNVAYAQMKKLHERDALTTLYNRGGFQDRCVGLLKQCKNNNSSMIIVSIDMDNLKSINDAYGHAMGDEAISTVAGFLIDFSEGKAICARFGGDEYVVLAETNDVHEYERKITDYINNQLDNFNTIGCHPYRLELSMGCAEVKSYDMDGVLMAFKEADDRMYEQKRKHKEKSQRE